MAFELKALRSVAELVAIGLRTIFTIIGGRGAQ